MLLILSVPLLAAPLPLSLEEITLYPGATRDQEAEQEYLDYMYFSDDVIFHEVRMYRIETIIDDVARFYLEYLQPELGWPEEDAEDLEPEEIMGPWYDLGFYGPQIFEHQYEYDTLIQDGKWIRTAFEGRPQWEKGKWLSNMSFQWVTRDEDGNLITHSIGVEDAGYDWRKRIDYKSTVLLLETTVVQGDLMWDDDWDDDWDWDGDLSWDMEDAIDLEIPTEKSLGIPFYPGMVFSMDLSQGMSMEDYHYYVFFSHDSLKQVADFYEKQLGKKALATDGDYLFALRGNLPIPTDGLAIQPNAFFTGFPQTMITIQKQIDD
jgi:hypothetical protein